MKIKYQLTIFNAITRSLVILALWFLLPVLIEKVVYKNINKSLLEKEHKFIAHLDKEEINNFIVNKDSAQSYASFSTLHSEFLQITRISPKAKLNKMIFINEGRIIEGEQDNYRILRYEFRYGKMQYQLEIGNSLSEFEELIFIIRLFVLIVLIVIFSFIFILDTFYIVYLFNPFYKIIDTKIRRVNEPETFDHTAIKTHSSDFQELDTVLNQMMNRISELFKKEKQFIANVSHELLTPIALLKNKFENLLQNDSFNDAAVDKIASSLKSLDMLKKVINNLLLISRIDNFQYDSNETVDLHSIIYDLAEDLKDRIEEKKIALNIELQNDFRCIGNSNLIHILFYNLYVNAIKYNLENGSILIIDGYSEGSYFISITDTGIGMDINQVNKIFKRFSRINKTQEGNGLGLAIVESIAVFHRIKIDVISSSNKGTTFRLNFPEQAKS